METAIGKSVQRKDAWSKVTGEATYTDDLPTTGILTARLLTSTYAHTRIVSIDVKEALGVSGVKTVLTGADCSNLFGPLFEDRPGCLDSLAGGMHRSAYGRPEAMLGIGGSFPLKSGLSERSSCYRIGHIRMWRLREITGFSS